MKVIVVTGSVTVAHLATVAQEVKPLVVHLARSFMLLAFYKSMFHCSIIPNCLHRPMHHYVCSLASLQTRCKCDSDADANAVADRPSVVVTLKPHVASGLAVAPDPQSVHESWISVLDAEVVRLRVTQSNTKSL